jgi:hypothetical protein
MSIILTLIDEKHNQLLENTVKKEERDRLVQRVDELNKELGSFDEMKVIAEIDELTDCAVKLGLIEGQETDNSVECAEVEQSQSYETAGV